MDREGSGRRRLTYEGSYNDSASWSPRGDRIAYVSRVSGHFQIFTIEPDGSNLQQITFTQDGSNEDPSWAPDGRHVVVSSDRSGSADLWILDVESRVARRLTDGDAMDTSPDWSGVARTPSASR
jgi:TolB protein